MEQAGRAGGETDADGRHSGWRFCEEPPSYRGGTRELAKPQCNPVRYDEGAASSATPSGSPASGAVYRTTVIRCDAVPDAELARTT
ncbi:MAG: hypothetical protein Rubg2KO_14820 [Rubricoccaceae bacterium]